MKDKIACFREIEDDFGIEIAIGVVQIRTLILSSKPKKSEVSGKKSFEKRMKKLSKKFLFDLTESDFDLCWEITEAIPSWQVGREMFGLGGSVEMKLKELITGIKRKI